MENVPRVAPIPSSDAYRYTQPDISGKIYGFVQRQNMVQLAWARPARNRSISVPTYLQITARRIETTSAAQ